MGFPDFPQDILKLLLLLLLLLLLFFFLLLLLLLFLLLIIVVLVLFIYLTLTEVKIYTIKNVYIAVAIPLNDKDGMLVKVNEKKLLQREKPNKWLKE